MSTPEDAAKPEELKRPYCPTAFERRLLVLYKRFKTIDEIPNHVSLAMMDRVKNRARVHFNMSMMGVFTVVFAIVAYQGKQAAKRSDGGVTKLNIEWHKEYNDPKNVERSLPGVKRE